MSEIICIMGPTATGKSQLALELSTHLAAEIVSVDSAMVYRGMDIGTAKPSALERAEVPHHLIDVCDPAEIYSAGQFRQQALSAIEAILQRGKRPLIVGGTMLYFYALQQGLSALPPADAKIRMELTAYAEEKGWQALYAKLQQIDPVTAAQLHPHDHHRILRALEIYQSAGQTQSALKNNRVAAPYRFFNLALIPTDRQQLEQRIRQRWDKMMQQGLLEEVQQLFQRGDLRGDLPAMRAVGYRQVWQYLAGEYDLATLNERAIIATRQLAKRQMTWLRSWPEVTAVNADQPPLAKAILKLLPL